MQTTNGIETLESFYESNNVPKVTRDIINDYFNQMVIDNKDFKTINYNVKIMKFTMSVIKTDFDKLTKRDIQAFQAVIRKKNCAESSKKQHVVGLKRFLHWYARNDDFSNRRDYLDLAYNIKMTFKTKQKIASDLLTGAEIMTMINVARNDRDAAIIAIFYDSGCRSGELLSCQLKHVTFERDECIITFPQSKTVARSSILIFAKGYLESYLRRHPLKNDPEAPLFVTENRVNVGTKERPIRKYVGLEHETILMIMKKTAIRAKITKRVYPHLFRHTRATELSTSLTEAELKAQFGWAPNSNVPSLYIHLSGEDAANALRKHYGLVDVKNNNFGIEMGHCENCKTLNPVTEQFCSVCHLPLSKDARMVSDLTKRALDSFFKDNSNERDKFMQYFFNDKK